MVPGLIAFAIASANGLCGGFLAKRFSNHAISDHVEFLSGGALFLGVCVVWVTEVDRQLDALEAIRVDGIVCVVGTSVDVTCGIVA